MANTEYSSKDIKVLEGLEPVRKRPGMYIGSTDYRGLHHLIWELVDNSIDEVMAGYADQIKVILHKDNSISVIDNGRGIPVDINPATKLSGVETVFTVLHAGGKFDNNAYKTAGGLHGVGSSVVNALSEYLICQVKKNQKLYEVKFKNGGQIDSGLKEIGTCRGSGTIVTFKPDKTIFDTIIFDPNIIKNRLKESAYLFTKLKIIFEDEINKETIEYSYSDGIKHYVKELIGLNKTISSLIYFEDEEFEIGVQAAFQFSYANEEKIVSFANSVKTNEGGSHENGFKQAITSCINNYARKLKLLKEKEKNLEGEDIREGLIAVLTVKIPEKYITYEGQTKNKLNTTLAFDAMKKIIEDKFSHWLNENKKESLAIIDQAKNNRDARLAAKKTRETTKKTRNKTIEKIISSKLTSAQKKDPLNNELFLVEGDSAGGSAKLGRDKKHQAILPLRGKVINVEKNKLEDCLKNEEISTIINCLGTDIGKHFDYSKLKYHKIIIMTDADVDGSHIQALLLTMFYKFLRPLIEKGNVYLAIPPLYKVYNKNKPNEFYYAWDDTQLEKAKQLIKSYEIQRYKGLGEMNADQLWETTMNPETRTLLQINVDDIIVCENQVKILMGDEIDIRKKWINENINFEYDE